MEVYVDDILVKRKRMEDHITNLDEAFKILKEYNMKLNPSKCAFGVSLGKFLGFMVSQRGIEANTEKIQALSDIESPKSIREVQRLTRRVAALNLFISRVINKCLPFFKTLRGGKEMVWTKECEKAFQELKRYMGSPSILSKPILREDIYLYLTISDSAVSSVLIREESKVQKPVYYVSYALLDAETRYPAIEKMALALVVSDRKLRLYFQAHTIVVLTNQPLR